ncbi:MAG: ABC transporter permease [Anaerolineae bacterium]
MALLEIVRRDLARNKYLYLLALPGVLFLVVFGYLPMFGHLIAFQKFRAVDGILRSPWVGLSNFRFFFASKDWLRITANTLLLNALFITGNTVIGLTLAVFLNEIRQYVLKRVAQSVVLLPYFVSWLVVALMLFALLNSTDGLVNRTLQSLGLQGIDWYTEPKYWRAILTSLSVWKWGGYTSVIYLAAITSIEGEYYEAARVDGASRLQQMWRITLPLLTPTTILLVLLDVGRIFYGDFGMIYGLVGDNGVLFPATDVIDTYTFRALRRLGNFSQAAAVSLYQGVMGILTIILINRLVRMIDPERALF